jgi:molybdopterin-containing oxidoreductase family membrane subunit
MADDREELVQEQQVEAALADRRARLERIQDQPPVVLPVHTTASVTGKIASIALTHPHTRPWLAAFGFASMLLLGLLVGIGVLLFVGVGVWGVNIPIAWGFAIVNFVWWIGIGHAGTLISAILLLVHQDWRNSINRFAEAMTLFAVTCAGLYPLLHLGRPWLFYWLVPYPNNMAIWPQFRSPLVWDVFAVATYFTVSLVFWYIALIPDMATLRDQATGRLRRFLYGFFAMGWRGSARHWHNFQISYLLLAGLATPLVVSVHTVVSFDFAVSILAGWHTTIFPPYFVAGAIFSGFAMVVNLAIPIRKLYGLEDLVTVRHLDNMAKIILATGMIVSYGYLMEAFMGWYSGEMYEQYVIYNRMRGPYHAVFWTVIWCNALIPHTLWFKRIRRNPVALFFVALGVQIGMWMERYMIVITSLHRDFLPSSWGMYSARFWDWLIFLGTIGLFFWMFLLFIRYIPMITMFEIREMVHKKSLSGGY